MTFRESENYHILSDASETKLGLRQTCDNDVVHKTRTAMKFRGSGKNGSTPSQALGRVRDKAKDILTR